MRIWLTAVLGLFMFAPAEAQTQTAMVWFYRPASANDLGSNPVVFYPYEIPSKRLAAMFPGEFFGYRLQPGTHAFSFVSAPARSQLVTVPLAAGEQAYVEIGPDHIGLVSLDKGIAAVQKSRPIAVVNAYDSAVLVPSGTAPVASIAQNIQPQAPIDQPSAARNIVAVTTPRTQESAEGDPNEPRRFEIAYAPYSFSRQGTLNQHGSFLSFTFNPTDTLGIVADLSAHKPIDDLNFTTMMFRFGPKFSARHGSRMTTFGQFLVGGARIQEEGTVTVLGSDMDLVVGLNGFSMYSGGGIDIAAKRWFAIRAEAGYSGMYFTDVGWSNGVRISGGLVFRIR